MAIKASIKAVKVGSTAIKVGTTAIKAGIKTTVISDVDTDKGLTTGATRKAGKRRATTDITGTMDTTSSTPSSWARWRCWA